MGLVSWVKNKFEKRTHPSNPADWLLYGLGGGSKTSAGIAVTEKQAMRLTAVFGCVKILAEATAALPLMLFKRVGNNGSRGRERADGHPNYDILHTSPNEDMTSFEWRELCMRDLGLNGNHYSHIIKDGTRVSSLQPFEDPMRMSMKRDGNTQQLFYLYHKPSGGFDIYPDHEVLHLRGLSNNGLKGLSPIGQAREAIGLAFAAEGSGSRLFAEGMMPSGVFTHPETFADSKARRQFKKSIKQAIGGLENWHKLLLLEEGMKWEPLSIPPEDAQFLQTRKFQVAEIARIYRVPLHMLAEMDRATFSNIEHQSLEFVIYTLTPWLVRLEQRYNASLLSRQERMQGYFFEHSVMGLLRGDIKSRYEAYRTARAGGWLNADEIRALENMNPIGEAKGGTAYLWPLNMAPSDMILDGTVGAAAKPPPALPVKGKVVEEQKGLPPIEEVRALEMRQGIRDQFERLFEEAVGRVVRRETIAVGRAVNKHLLERSRESFEAWLDEFYGTMEPHVLRQMRPLFMSYSDAVTESVKAEMVLGEEITNATRLFTETYAEGYAKRHVGNSLRQLRKLIKDSPPEELAAAIEARLDEWAKARASKIATDEVVRAESAVMLEAWGNAGVEKVRWIAHAGACEWCRQLDGIVVAIHGAFLEKGQHLTVQDEPKEGETQGKTRVFENWTSQKHPPLHRGCKCSVGVA